MRKKSRKNKSIFSVSGFVLPALVINIIVILVPAIMTVILAFFEWDGLNIPQFVGIKNFVTIFRDANFLKALTNNLVWTLIFLTVPVIMGLIVAELLRKTKWRFLQPFFFFPTILPIASVGLIWKFIYHPIRGLGKYLDIVVLGNTKTALYAIAFANIWAWWGFLCVVFYSAMQGISSELYESARLDGANKWQEFIYITIPQIIPTIVFMEVMTIIWSFLVFDWVWIMTQGGPASSSELLATLLYKKAFYSYKVGEASAIGVIISLFGFLGVSLYYYLSRKGVEV
ncbi:MAG: raffinose/stachyose/melibiose transport system permease protein [Petrotoga sp.]|nr:raffinose/stachyose/melibiose transport system permease protein [Petrotoga sp.]